jgi:hypothetical protein
MMKKSLSLAFFGLFLLAPLALPPAAGAEVSSRRDIYVAAGEIQEKIFSLGGNVLIEGTVREDVIVIGGSITISGEAGQSVVGIGSRIIVMRQMKARTWAASPAQALPVCFQVSNPQSKTAPHQ